MSVIQKLAVVYAVLFFAVDDGRAEPKPHRHPNASINEASAIEAGNRRIYAAAHAQSLPTQRDVSEPIIGQPCRKRQGRSAIVQ